LFIQWPRAIAEIPVFIIPGACAVFLYETVSFMLGSIYPNSWLDFEVTTKSPTTIICYIPVTPPLRPSVGPDGRFRAGLGNEQMLPVIRTLEYPEGNLASLPYHHLQHYSQDCRLRQVSPHLGGIGILRVLEVKKYAFTALAGLRVRLHYCPPNVR
jgi:hypothetical protein